MRNKYGHTPKQAAYDIVAGWGLAALRSHTGDLDEACELESGHISKTFSTQVRAQLSKLVEKLEEKVGY